MIGAGFDLFDFIVEIESLEPPVRRLETVTWLALELSPTLELSISLLSYCL